MEMPKNFKRATFSAYMFALCLFLFVSTSVEFDIDYSTNLPGSTRGLANIFVGRCFDYLQLYKHLKLHPDEADQKDPATFCQETWQIFKQAFALKDICTVKPEAYIPYLEKTGSTEKKPVTADKLLLWSGTFELSGQYANHGQRTVALADTFTGYLVTGLNWCGAKPGENQDGINYVECKRCKTSKESIAREGFEVFWGIASESFAKRAVGLVRHLVNGTGVLPDGTPRPAFEKNTPTEHCNTGSLSELQKAIAEQGKKTNKIIPNECVENPIDILHLMCVDAYDAKECAFKNAIFGYSQEQAVSHTEAEIFKKFFQRKQEPKPVIKK